MSGEQWKVEERRGDGRISERKSRREQDIEKERKERKRQW